MKRAKYSTYRSIDTQNEHTAQQKTLYYPRISPAILSYANSVRF